MASNINTKNPHAGQPVAVKGEPLETAKAAMVMVHGRNATTAHILSLVPEIDQPGFVYLAPQAAGNTWYPNSFLADLESNEPNLSSAFNVLQMIFSHLRVAGIAPEKTILLGFSQGACLALEFAARNARRYGGVVGLSGGLIGPDGTPREYGGGFDGTPIFIGCSDVDSHVPLKRVQESAKVLREMGAEMTPRIYPGMGHTVNDDEIAFVRTMMQQVVSA